MLFATPQSQSFLGILPWYSVLIVTGIALAILLSIREERRLNLKKDTVIDSAFYLIPFGIVGARLYYVAFEWQQFSRDLIRIFFVWEGGVAIYGALIGGFLGLLLFAKRRKLSFPMLLDLFIPSVALAQGIGRWGNYFNQEAYGYAVTNPAHQFFPLAVYITNLQTPAWHYATFFYESVWDVGIFIALICIKKRKRMDGDVFLWYLLLYGIGRAFIEGMRADSLMAFGGAVRISQLLSLCLALIVAGYFIFRYFRRKHHA